MGKRKTLQPTSKEDIVSSVLSTDAPPKKASSVQSISKYRNMLLNEALDELLPDGELVENHAILLRFADPAIKYKAVELAYKLKGYLKEDTTINVVQNMIGDLASMTPEQIQAEIDRVEKESKARNKTTQTVVEGEVILDDVKSKLKKKK